MQTKSVKYFFLSVSFAPLSNNEGCAYSYDIMSVWKIMSSSSLFLIEANNLSLEEMYSNWLPSLPAFETVWNQDHWGTHSCGQYFLVTFVLWKLKKENCIPSHKSEISCPVPHCTLSRQRYVVKNTNLFNIWLRTEVRGDFNIHGTKYF